MTPFLGYCEVRASFLGRPARYVQIVRKVFVGFQLESLRDQRRYAGRGCTELFAQLVIFCKRWSVDDCRNRVGRLERLLIHEQFIECPNDHTDRSARITPRLTGDWRLETGDYVIAIWRARRAEGPFSGRAVPVLSGSPRRRRRGSDVRRDNPGRACSQAVRAPAPALRFRCLRRRRSC